MKARIKQPTPSASDETACSAEMVERYIASIQQEHDHETEQAAFEEWLEVARPSGDAESVHRQWGESSAFRDLFNGTNAELTHPESKP